MARDLEQIRREREGTATARNLIAVLHAKLDLASRYGLYEYEAVEEDNEACADVFCALARNEREQIGRLLPLLTEPGVGRRFRRIDTQDPVEDGS